MWNTVKTWIGDLADKVPAPVVMGQVRHFLTGAGGVALGLGVWANAEWWVLIVGGVAYAIGAGWSWLQKLNDPQQPA